LKIRVLGCHGSEAFRDRLPAVRQHTTCGFLVDETLMIDAGAIGSRLRWEEQFRIRTILLTHLHFDHIKELPTLADNLAGETSVPIEIAGTQEVLDGLRAHVFNGSVYPDFFRIPTAAKPVFQTRPLDPDRSVTLGRFQVTPVPVNHTVPAVGYLISDGRTTFLYSGDTYSTDELWRVASSIPSLHAAFIETSYPDEMGELAAQSKHLTPSLLAEELRKLKRDDIPVYIYHMKPRHRESIVTQLSTLGLPHLRVLEEGQEISL
jgi:cAMP phosphodiesterase